MNEAVTAWPGAVPAAETEKQSARGARALWAVVTVLALGLIAGVGGYVLYSGALSNGTTSTMTPDRVKSIAFWLLTLTAFGGLVSLVVAGVLTSRSDRVWAARLQARDAEWRKSAVTMRTQLADMRASEEANKNSEEQLRAQLATISHTHAQLESELNHLKRAEKNLSQQRQSLESSKSVLEIHVEARTKELQKLQRRYEHILNSAGEGICGLDIEGCTTFANPAVEKITGWAVAELIGKTEEEIFGISAPDSGNDSTTSNPGEQFFRRKDGTPFVVELVRTPINENGRVTGSVLVFKDITERKRAEETLSQRAAELSRSNAELEQFAFVASHDLQEPLRKIQAFGDRLKTKCQGAIAAEAHDYLERMQSASARMRTLIDDLLTFSRVIRNSVPFSSVSLDTVAKEVLGDLEVRIEKSGATVEVGSLPTIEADPLQMRQLLLNLIGNALKFQPPGARPVIKIHSRNFNLPSGEAMCELNIQDNGIGFEEKYLDKIFAVFQRLHGRTEYEGTGVGLAVCRRITDRHHGTITARSELGKGSTFIVTLPLRQPGAET